ALCDREGMLLIFDEVISGFRAAAGGAQQIVGVRPDLTCLGKIIGGGLPVGAYGGRREIMELIAPAGPVYQAGTLSGNPLAMTAGIETLRIIDEDPEFYTRLAALCENLYDGFRSNLSELKLNYTINTCGSMFTLFFAGGAVTDFDSAKTSDTVKFRSYFGRMLDNGVYLPPSQFEACFVSSAHQKEDLDRTIAANYLSLKVS